MLFSLIHVKTLFSVFCQKCRKISFFRFPNIDIIGNQGYTYLYLKVHPNPGPATDLQKKQPMLFALMYSAGVGLRYTVVTEAYRNIHKKAAGDVFLELNGAEKFSATRQLHKSCFCHF